MDFSQNLILLVFDTETTGLSSRSGNRVVDLAVQALLWDARSQALEVSESAQWYFNPQRASEPGAARVHRLSQKFLHSQPPAKEQMPKIIKWIRGSFTGRVGAARGIDIWLVAHNAIFDVGFVNSEMQHVGLPGTFVRKAWASGVLCTRRLFQTAVPTADRYSQNALCEWADVDTSTRRNAKGEEVHGALADCRLLACALQQMHQRLGTERFAAACRRSLLDAVSVATLDSKKYPAFA